jgi:hypothetical protein
MKLSGVPTFALLAAACSVFTDVAVALTRHQVPNFRSGLSRAAPPGDAAAMPYTIKNATFQQLIDHENPHL